MFKLAQIRGLITALALGLSAAVTAGSAFAQSTSQPQPPVLSTVDPNGVNLATGLPSVPGLNVGIGGSGSGIGRQVQSYLYPNGSIPNADNFSGFWMAQFLVYSADMGGPLGRETAFVSYGGVTHRFVIGGGHQSSLVYVQAPYHEWGGAGNSTFTCSGTGAQVQAQQGTCTLLLGDGTSVFYSSGSMQTVTKPDGEVITVTYNSNGNLVSSTLGWTLKYNLDSNNQVVGVTAVNTTVAPCTVTSCAPPAGSPVATSTLSGTTHTLALNGVNIGSYTTGSGSFMITSPGGVTRTYALITATTNLGKVSSVAYAGQTWNYSYSTDGTVTTVTEPNGKTRQVTTDTTSSKVMSQTDEAGRTTSYVYDGSDRVIQVVSPDGNANTGGFTSYVYDTAGRITEVDIVPKGGATGGTPNAGAAIVTKAQYGVTCDYVTFTNAKYCNKPTTTTDANGVVTTYAYDTNGNLISTTLPAVNGVTPQTRYTYAPQTPHAYDLNGNFVAQPVVYRLTMTSSCMSSNWNSSTLVCGAGATDERRTTVTYNTSNILPYSTTTSRGDGSLAQTTTIAQYTNNGQVLVSDGPKPGAVDETYYFYDPLGRQVGMVGIDPDGTGSRHRHANHTYYDNDGHVIEVDTGIVGNGTTNIYSGADAPTRNSQAFSDWGAMTSASSLVQERNISEFDSFGRPIIAAHYIGNAATAKDVTQRSYDSMQRLSCEAVRLNSADFVNDYASLKSIGACALGTTGADGSRDRIIQNNYDPVTGLLTSTINAYGTSAARTEATKAYDTTGATSTGTLTYVEDAKGNRTSFFYDSFDRLIKSCYPLAATAHTSSSTDCAQTAFRTSTLTGTTQASPLTWNTTARDGQVTTTTYDGLGRVSNNSGADAETFTYDNFNQVLSHGNTTPGNSGLETYTYNALGWLLSDAQPMGTMSYSYDPYGKRSQLTWPGGTFFTTYAYDDGGELTGIFENGTTQVAGLAYDDYGRRTSVTRGNGVPTSYGYDANLRLGTLTQGTSGASFYNQVTYGYNAANQITSKTATNAGYEFRPTAASVTYGINGLNQIGTIGASTFGYDVRGNLTGDGSGSSYSYNVNNLLTSTTQSSVTTTLTYDPENRLESVSKTGLGTTQFLYDGNDLVAEYSSGTLTRRYVQGPGSDEPLVWYDVTGGTKYYLGADDNDSVVTLTNSAGAQYGINTYDEYGLPGSGNIGRFQYTGQAWLAEIGMYYYKARLYNPAIGRFMQTDPIGYGDGMNMYAYVHGDPVNMRDVKGTCGSADEEDDSGNCHEDFTGNGWQNGFDSGGFLGDGSGSSGGGASWDAFGHAMSPSQLTNALADSDSDHMGASLIEAGATTANGPFSGTSKPGALGGLGGLLGDFITGDRGGTFIQSARVSYFLSDYKKHPQDWVIVMRWYGNTAGIFGRSWTQIANSSVPYPRNTFGIPDGSDPTKNWGNNSMQYYALGAIALRDFENSSFVQQRSALPYGKYDGGGPEVFINAYVVASVVIVYKWDIPWPGRK